MAHYPDIFSINPEDKIPGKGRVLISEPFLTDRFFNRTIVFLTEHTAEGTVGFILNRVIDLMVSSAVDGFDGWDEHLSVGGPWHRIPFITFIPSAKRCPAACR